VPGIRKNPGIFASARVERTLLSAAFDVDFDFVERESRAIFSGFRFVFVSLENKYFRRWLVGRIFLGFVFTG
jgi:hypothetical protein